MKIAHVQAYEYDAAYTHGQYAMSHGRSARSQRSLVVRVTTLDGLEGWSESCPNGRTYLPSFIEGERAALELLARAVLGADPRNLAELSAIMESVLLGSNAAKSLLDIACWDLFGQSVALPVHQLLGGQTQEDLPLFVSAPVGSLQSMAEFAEREAALGVRVLQVKVGDEYTMDVARIRAVLEAVGPQTTVIADANGGWNVENALLAAAQLEGLPVRLEQPCRTMTDCAQVRRQISLPLILDECIVTIEDLVRAKCDVGATGVNIKASRLGGFTNARAMRDTATGLGMTFTVDDTWGGALTTAQNAHLAASSHPEHLTGVTFFSEWTEPRIATGPRSTGRGRGTVPTSPGLGVVVDRDMLGKPVLDI
jgi:L-alanine-DL-glutamate epimerase-like enolase superfamily enzyme